MAYVTVDAPDATPEVEWRPRIEKVAVYVGATKVYLTVDEAEALATSLTAAVEQARAGQAVAS